MKHIKNYPDKMQEKLGISFEILKIEYENAHTRFRDWYGKFNMLLALLTGEIAVFGLILSSFKTTSLILLLLAIISAIFLLVTLICIAIGMFPRKISVIDVEDLVKMDYYFTNYDKFLAAFLKSYSECINTLDKISQKKAKVFISCIIMSGIAFALITIMGGYCFLKN